MSQNYRNTEEALEGGQFGAELGNKGGSSPLDILCSEEFGELVEANIEREPTAIALDKSLKHNSLVASQVKYLQRAKTKLPSYFAARCIIPQRAYEQCSSEAVAMAKCAEGGSLLELTCGLGVDAVHFSKYFERVVTLERDEELAKIAKENFKRLGINNIEVVNCSAEEYLATCTERFDMVYVDPDRRRKSGERVVRLEDCSPNIIELKALIMSHSEQLMVKLSPLFDIDEAFRIFSPATVEVISSDGECKELLVTTLQSGEDMIHIKAVGVGELELKRSEVDNRPSGQPFDIEAYTHLITPDVSLQKSRTACYVLGKVADIWSNNGYGFANFGDGETPEILGRVERINSIEEYNPKRLKSRLKELNIKGLEILKREFPYTPEKIASTLKIKQGGAVRVAFTTINGRLFTIHLQ